MSWQSGFVYSDAHMFRHDGMSHLRFDHMLVDQEQWASFSVLSRLRFDTMRTTHIPSLADVAADAAAGSIITDYLTARGVRKVPTLAFIAKTEEELDRHLIQPLFAGYTQGAQRFEVPNQEQPIIQAIMLHMWNTCKQLWATHATPPPSSTPPATTTPSHPRLRQRRRSQSSCLQGSGALCSRPTTRPSSMGSIAASLNMRSWGRR